MNAVWSDTRTKGSERLVLLAIADMANENGYCWPGFDYLSKKCNLGRRFIIKIVSSLESKGLIKREHRFDKHGDQTSNIYCVCLGVNYDSPPTGEQEFTTPVNDSSPKSLINHNGTETKEGATERASLSPVGENKYSINHPAIQAIKLITGYYPDKILYKRIIDTIGDNPDIEKMRLACETWVANGHRNKSDFKGWLFDWYVEDMYYVSPQKKFR